MMGMVMPRHARLTEEVTRRIEDFVVTLLLPVFFVYTGLKTNIRLLDRPELWLHHAAADRGRDRRQARRRGDRRAGRRLRLARLGGDRHADEHPRADRADRAQPRARRRRDLQRAVRGARDHGGRHHVDGRAAAEAARPHATSTARASRTSSPTRRSPPRASIPALPVPERSILVAPQTDAALEQLIALAEPLARSAPQRELIIARLVRAAPGRRACAAVCRPRTCSSSGPRRRSTRRASGSPRTASWRGASR